jgi:hypothetical protein
LRQIDAAIVAKRWDRLARIGVERDKISPTRANKNALLITIGLIGDPAVHEAKIGG